jgi:hypothetical protein
VVLWLRELLLLVDITKLLMLVAGDAVFIRITCKRESAVNVVILLRSCKTTTGSGSIP